MEAVKGGTMDKPLIGVLMILILVLTTSLIISEYKMEKDIIKELKIATKVAARSACLERDKDATAKKGYIIIDENEAQNTAKIYFFKNLNRFKAKADDGNLQIFIINDAPGNFTLHDRTHYFASNGVAVGYHYKGAFILSVDETDDF